MRADRLEQVFVERGAGALKLSLVLESEAGARERVTMSAPGLDEAVAIDFLTTYLRQNGFRLAQKLRVRRQRAGGLDDAPELAARLVANLGAAGRRSGYEDDEWD